MKKLENLISFDDFNSNWKPESQKSTKRTSTGLDILKENIEEIIPEGTPENNFEGKSTEEKIEEITEFLDNEPDDDVVEEIVNILRDGLNEMEQMGFIEPEQNDELDDLYGDDWITWCKEVIKLPDFFEEGLDNVLDFIQNVDTLEFGQIGDDEDVECPDCEGSGEYEDGEECERCYGTGRVDRPYDIPPDE